MGQLWQKKVNFFHLFYRQQQLQRWLLTNDLESQSQNCLVNVGTHFACQPETLNVMMTNFGDFAIYFFRYVCIFK
jgi:hypothetical protein